MSEPELIELTWHVTCEDDDFECGSIEVTADYLDEPEALLDEVVTDFDERSQHFEDYAQPPFKSVLVQMPDGKWIELAGWLHAL